MIVVAGEALVDLVPLTGEQHEGLSPLLPRLGGGPYNVAVALGRLGGPVHFLSRISTDTFGDALIDRLRASGVELSLVQRGNEPTSLAVVGLSANGSARYGFYVTGTADRLVADPGALPDSVTALSFGTLSLVLEPGASVYETVLHRAAQHGTFTALDPNVRRDLISDADAYRARFRSWLPDVTLLKLSIEDAEWLAGHEEGSDVLPWLSKWQQAGPAAVVLTKGANGLAVLTGAGELVQVPAVPARVVDTIGAGDTIQGALLAWLSQRDALNEQKLRTLSSKDWCDALSFAAAAAAITVSRAGAEPPYAAELVK